MTEIGTVVIRGILGFIVLFILARLMGKKHLTDMTYYEYIVGIAIGSIAAELTFGTQVRVSNFIVGMIIWALLPMIISQIELRSFGFRKFSEGSPTVLIEKGKVYEKNLKKVSLTIDELMIHLRQKDVFKLSDVESAVMEKNGQVSVMKHSNVQPITSKDMGMPVQPEHQPRIVVMDGNLMEKNLSELGYNQEWLLNELNNQGANSFSEVFLAQVDSKGNVYIDLYNDQLEMSQIKQKLLLAANIKQLQTNLMNFSLQAENEEAKEMYKNQAQNMETLLDNMTAYLKE
ncbi:DUF421 domain-containing protein [Salipaludibacillus neizhouensis]|uniref:DUF421 domain-containing protein n=1 Tax=Salipaludibacillus neizhouensis TaxID=885475 RepID=A0A3A9K2Q5_9BACI|nr:DUF421 domain-containing protein [Salipaludibacillus neizhouensis]RKL67424.1 DUF421 domain-containing protein [Salipaludibacillus neizhouensis]